MITEGGRYLFCWNGRCPYRFPGRLLSLSYLTVWIIAKRERMAVFDWSRLKIREKTGRSRTLINFLLSARDTVCVGCADTTWEWVISDQEPNRMEYWIIWGDDGSFWLHVGPTCNVPQPMTQCSRNAHVLDWCVWIELAVLNFSVVTKISLVVFFFFDKKRILALSLLNWNQNL